jgi:hypothetical protein
MPRYNISSLALYSESGGHERVTEVLGLEPKRTRNKGDRKTGKDGRQYSPVRHSVWIYDPPESEVDPNDDSGFATLRALVNAVRDRADALASLRPEYRTVIWWSGEVSPQGNFAIDADIVVGLGLLGCEFYGSVSLEEIPDEEEV